VDLLFLRCFEMRPREGDCLGSVASGANVEVIRYPRRGLCRPAYHVNVTMRDVILHIAMSMSELFLTHSQPEYRSTGRL